MTEEVWKPVVGVGEIADGYKVSSLGRIMTPAGKVLKECRAGGARKHVQVKLSGVKISLHKLVALAHLGFPPGPNMLVRHKDDNPLNGAASNLEWARGKYQGVTGDSHPLSGPVIGYNGSQHVAFGSAGEATRAMGFHAGAVSRVCGGLRSNVGGWIFAWAASATPADLEKRYADRGKALLIRKAEAEERAAARLERRMRTGGRVGRPRGPTAKENRELVKLRAARHRAEDRAAEREIEGLVSTGY